MKKIICLFIILMVVIPFCLMADDTIDGPVAVSAGPGAIIEADTVVESVSFNRSLWAFLNSPLGMSVVAFILSFVLGKIFTAKPKWKQILIKHGPKLMQAVKMAEKNIPDDTDNKGLCRLDEALRYLVKLEPKLKKITDGELKEALTAVHATAETNRNLKKE